MSSFQPLPSNTQTSTDPLFIECVEKLLPLAGERIQTIDLNWWNIDRFMGLAFHILLTEETLSIRQRIANLLPRFGKKAVPTLFVIYQHQNSDAILRYLSGQALAELQPTELVAGLINTLKTAEDDRFDIQVSQMLATFMPEAIATLITLIHTEKWRTLALRTLHQMQLPETRALIDQLICHSQPSIRQATIDILSQSKDQQVICRLENALTSYTPLESITPPKKAPTDLVLPKSIDSLMKLAAIQMEKQECLGAIHSYSEVIDLQPEHANAYGNRGLLKLNIGDYQGAIIDFQHAAQLFFRSGKTANFEIVLNYLRKISPSDFDRPAFPH